MARNTFFTRKIRETGGLRADADTVMPGDTPATEPVTEPTSYHDTTTSTYVYTQPPPVAVPYPVYGSYAQPGGILPQPGGQSFGDFFEQNKNWILLGGAIIAAVMIFQSMPRK